MPRVVCIDIGSMGGFCILHFFLDFSKCKMSTSRVLSSGRRKEISFGQHKQPGGTAESFVLPLPMSPQVSPKGTCSGAQPLALVRGIKGPLFTEWVTSFSHQEGGKET